MIMIWIIAIIMIPAISVRGPGIRSCRWPDIDITVPGNINIPAIVNIDIIPVTVDINIAPVNIPIAPVPGIDPVPVNIPRVGFDIGLVIPYIIRINALVGTSGRQVPF